jgi:hypothetical protein
MKIKSEKVKEETIGKDEAGNSEFKDSGLAIEMGDKAFVIYDESPFSGKTEKIYFKERENAEAYL